ncbi:MAG: energy-coupling factor transporter ATPase [Pelosinus sp.]|nr:energy-coupling factor transporter ATPase [Pelosinus sp.]
MSIELKNISYIYMKNTPFEHMALQNISLTINPGEFVGIIGHTGSGKSTLVQHLNGLLKPGSGEVFVDEVDLNARGNASKLAKRKVGMVFQYPEHQLFEETIAADIAFGPRSLGCEESEIKQRVCDAMEFVGLDYDTFAERSPFQLSGGQMRRVAIAGVIALKPEYLVLDEPSAGLDPRGREEIFSQIMHLYNKTGIAVIMVSHNMEEVARMATRLIVMNQGQISLDGNPREIFKNGSVSLQAAGVDVPRITALMRYLKGQGLKVDDTVITAEEGVKSILSALGGQGTC